MSIIYDKLFDILKDKGITVYRLKKDKIIGAATIEKMKKREGHIDDRSINSICEYLQIQPGDFMEYVPDEDVTPAQTDK